MHAAFREDEDTLYAPMNPAFRNTEWKTGVVRRHFPRSAGGDFPENKKVQFIRHAAGQIFDVPFGKTHEEFIDLRLMGHDPPLPHPVGIRSFGKFSLLYRNGLDLPIKRFGRFVC